jgi:hypothetical protein
MKNILCILFILLNGAFLYGANSPYVNPPDLFEIQLTWNISNTCIAVNEQPVDTIRLKDILHRVKEMKPDSVVHLFVEDRVPAGDLMRVFMALDRDFHGSVILVPQPKLHTESHYLDLKWEKQSLRKFEAPSVLTTNGLCLERVEQVFRNQTKRTYTRDQLLEAWRDPTVLLRQKYLAASCLAEPGETPEAIRAIIGKETRMNQSTWTIESWDGAKAEPRLTLGYSFQDGVIDFEFILEMKPEKTWCLSALRISESTEYEPVNKNSQPNEASQGTARKLAAPGR